MGEYMRTLLNGLKAWVGGEIGKLLAKIETVATAASKTASLAAKNKKDIAALSDNINGAWQVASSASSTAATAKSTADTAKSTADTAKSTADTAKRTADTAKSTASSALSVANGAEAKASSAQTAASEAKQNAANALTKANAASTTAENAYPLYGAQTLHIRDAAWTSVSGATFIRATKGQPVYWSIPRYLDDDVAAPARLVLSPNATSVMRVEGINVLRMKSSGGKEFDITVSDDGTLTTTEVTS